MPEESSTGSEQPQKSKTPQRARGNRRPGRGRRGRGGSRPREPQPSPQPDAPNLPAALPESSPEPFASGSAPLETEHEFHGSESEPTEASPLAELKTSIEQEAPREERAERERPDAEAERERIRESGRQPVRPAAPAAIQ